MVHMSSIELSRLAGQEYGSFSWNNWSLNVNTLDQAFS